MGIPDNYRHDYRDPAQEYIDSLKGSDFLRYMRNAAEAEREFKNRLSTKLLDFVFRAVCIVFKGCAMYFAFRIVLIMAETL